MSAQSASKIKMIVGLGNPGDKYNRTRHNAGFWFLDQLVSAYHASFKAESKFHGHSATITMAGADVRLLKPTTFMNHSGRAVSSLAKFYKVNCEEILIVHDELDLSAGVARFKCGGGHGGHNGLRDTIAALSNKNFWRLRVGIGHPGHSSEVVNYVLKNPSKVDEKAIMDSLGDAALAIEDFVAGEQQKAMMRLHSSN